MFLPPRLLAVFLTAMAGFLPQATAHASHIELAGRLDGAAVEYGDWRPALDGPEAATALPPVEVIFVVDATALATPWSDAVQAPYGIVLETATALPAAVPDAPQQAPSDPNGFGVLAAGVLAVALAGRGKGGQRPFDPR
jgi:hypothetical protein